MFPEVCRGIIPSTLLFVHHPVFSVHCTLACMLLYKLSEWSHHLVISFLAFQWVRLWMLSQNYGFQA